MNCELCRDNEITCIHFLYIEGKFFNKIPYGIDLHHKPELVESYEKMKQRDCPDCGVRYNGFHHNGCDWQRCPKCLGQRLQCEMLGQCVNTVDWSEFMPKRKNKNE